VSDFELYMSEPSFARGARLAVVESPYASLGGDPSYLRECLWFPASNTDHPRGVGNRAGVCNLSRPRVLLHAQATALGAAN
jgi:hypothetical protein